MKIVAAFTVLLVSATVALAQSDDWADDESEWSSEKAYAESKGLCRAVKGKQPPASDRPDSAARRALKGCDSEALYYGIGRPADPVKARQCAFLETETAQGEGPFSGRAMLMTIYANGIGAKRDLDVAMHLACGVDGAPMESHGRVRHLAELRASKWKGRDFHFCDDITSGLAMGYCAGHHASIEGAKREAGLAKLASAWTAREKQAFAALRKAHEAFVGAHSDGEIDLSGTARAAMQVGAEEGLRDEFVEMLGELVAGRAPRATAAQYKAADARLNAAYRNARAGAGTEPGHPGAVTKAGILEAQRAWLRFRDSFLAFAALKFPAFSRDSLAAWLTEKRTLMLLAEK